MKTLGKSITSRIFKNEQSYAQLRQEWSVRMWRREEISFFYHGFYMLLLGKDWTRAFQLPSRPRPYSEHVHVRFVCQLKCYLQSKKQWREENGYFEQYLSNEASSLLLQILPTMKELAQAGERGVYQPYREIACRELLSQSNGEVAQVGHNAANL